MSTHVVRRLSVLAAASAAVFATAFSCEASTSSISADDLAKSIAQQFKDKTGEQTGVTCKDSLNATTGQTATCTATAHGVTADLKVSFTEKKDDKIYFTWEIVDSTRKLSAAKAKELLSPGFTEQTGLALTKLDCPGGVIPGQVGKVVDCSAETGNGVQGTIKITVSSADQLDVGLEWAWQS